MTRKYNVLEQKFVNRYDDETIYGSKEFDESIKFKRGLQNPNNQIIEGHCLELDTTNTAKPAKDIGGLSVVYYDKNGKPAFSSSNYHSVGNNIGANNIVYRTINNTVKKAVTSLGVDASGNAYFDFPKCTQKPTTASTASSSRVAVVVKTYLNGTTCCREYSDGFIEQFGRVNIKSAQELTVTLPKPFATANYCLPVLSTIGLNNVSDNVLVRSMTNKAFVCRATNSSPSGEWGPVPCMWYACGY